MTGWHANYDPCIWRHRANEEQKRIGCEMWVRMDRIMCAVLREAHEGQVEEAMDALADGPKASTGASWRTERSKRGRQSPAAGAFGAEA